MGTTSKGEMAPPIRLAIQTMPCALARSTVGNQREMLEELLGYAPASPAPNKNRIGSSIWKLAANPVKVVKADHHSTIRVRTFRGPIRSPIEPLGISNAAYEIAKTPTTQPHHSGPIFRSSCMRGPATAMQTRSRYVMIESRNSIPRTRWRYFIRTHYVTREAFSDQLSAISDRPTASE